MYYLHLPDDTIYPDDRACPCAPFSGPVKGVRDRLGTGGDRRGSLRPDVDSDCNRSNGDCAAADD